MLKITFILIFVLSGSKSAKILGVFPTASISHQVVFRPLMLELSKRGHEVTVITADPAFIKGQTPQNLTEIDIHDISYKVWNNFLSEHGKEKNRVKYFKLVHDLLTHVFEAQLKSAAVQKLLSDNKKFDLVFKEPFVRPALIFSHIYNASVIELSSLGGLFLSHELTGSATHPLIYPDPFHRRIYNLTVWEKIEELYVHYSSLQQYKDHIFYEDEMLRRVFGTDIPSLNELTKNVRMLFLNVHHFWDFNRPVPPNVLYLGGMHQKTEKEIPQVFSKLPYDILWKWDKDELSGRPKNVKISKWLPQADLLRHPKVKLFVTQGGLQSTDEAITAGVPLIGIPMLGDQWFNTEHYVKFNIGKKLAIETLTEDELMESIQTVLKDRSYYENIIKLRNIIRDQPQSSLERAVWWTEYVLRHKGAAHLRAPNFHISWAEYYELELVMTLSAIAILALLVSVFMICFIVSRAKRSIHSKVKIH